MPGMPMPGFAPPGLPGLLPPPGLPSFLPPPTSFAPQNAAPTEMPVPDSSVMLKSDQKLLYGDNDVSPEEKRAKQPRYVVKGEDASTDKDGQTGALGGRSRAADFL